MKGNQRRLAQAAACLLALTITTGAKTTEGYILGGYGATQTGNYAPKGSVSGSEMTPFGPTLGSNITASLSEARLTIG